MPQQTGVGISISPPAEGPGSETMLVQSLSPGNLPLIPPVPQTTLVFKGRAGDPPLTLIVDAGAINLPIHLRFTPLEPAVVPPAWAGAEVVHAFRLEAFDMDGGRREGLPVARPVKLRLPIALWADTDGQDSQLLLAALDREGDGWQPLITAYYPRLQELRARLLSFSTLALIKESS